MWILRKGSNFNYLTAKHQLSFLLSKHQHFFLSLDATHDGFSDHNSTML